MLASALRAPRLRALTVGVAGGVASSALLQSRPSTCSSLDVDADPHLWLEQVEGEDALSWCRSQNDRTIAAVGDPKDGSTYHKILAIADAKDKIPYVGRIGGTTGDDRDRCWYNFWQDAEHPRGLWRRTSLDSFRTSDPEWEDVIDVDALNADEGIAEGEQYVWHGYSVLDEGPGGRWDRAVVFLSPGGTDAQIAREFDLRAKVFVPAEDGGFATTVPAKCDVGFRRRDEVLVGTDFDGDAALSRPLPPSPAFSHLPSPSLAFSRLLPPSPTFPRLLSCRCSSAPTLTATARR